MQHKVIYGVAIITLFQTYINSSSLPYFSLKSQSTNAFQYLIDTTILYPDPEFNAGAITISPNYTRSFNTDDLVPCFIGNDCLNMPNDERCCKDTIFISGSRVASRKGHDWLADYFGLPPDFQSKITLSPEIDNFIVHINLAVSLGCKTYFRLYAPITHSRWRLGFCEQIINGGELGYDAGYFDTNEIPRVNLLDSFRSFIGNEQIPQLTNVIFKPLEHGKWNIASCNRLHKTGISDTILFIGYNFLVNDNYHLSFEGLGIIPTGNRPQGNFFFEPVVGNGKHGGIGAALSSHYIVWEDAYYENSFGIYCYAWIAHLFQSDQCRTFDLINGCNSRYMLAERINPPVSPNLWANPLSGNQANSNQPNKQFKNMLTPIANLTHRKVQVDISMYGEAALLFNYSHCGLSIDVGYNYWARSCEKICLAPRSCSKSLLMEQWALKGDAHIFGFAATGPTCPTAPVSPTGPCLDLPIALSATQNNSTLMSGLNNFVGPNPDEGGLNGIRPTRNPGVDNAQFGRLVEGSDPDAFILDRSISNGGLQTQTSLEPITLSDKMINVAQAQSKGQSHTLFMHVNYAWMADDCWTPYAGIGLSIEWGKNSSKTKGFIDQENSVPYNHAKHCTLCTLSQWGIWFKTGLSFY